MPIYTGKSEDGSDMKEVEGMYMHPNGKEWSSNPYPKSLFIAFDAYHSKHKHIYEAQEPTEISKNIFTIAYICKCGKTLN